MEVAAVYGSDAVRPRLTVVKDGSASYSALPHAVLFSDLSDGAVRLYAVLQAHWWGESGECTASHATLSAESGKKERTVRTLLVELEAAGVIVARRAGRGQAKAYAPSGRNRPVASGEIRPVERPKRPKSANKAAEIGQFKRPKSAAPIEEDKGKKTKEEDKKRSNERLPKAPSAQSRVIDLIREGGVPEPTFGGRAGRAIKETGADPEDVAAAYLAVWRGEWGDQWLRDNLSIHAVVDRLDGFKAWRHEQGVEAPRVNGVASKVTPPTDDDLEIWRRAIGVASGTMNRSNVEAYLTPLTVAGRFEAGGLCLVAPLDIGPDLKRFKNHIIRALEDAGDPCPSAVAFKTPRRAPQENQHAE